MPPRNPPKGTTYTSGSGTIQATPRNSLLGAVADGFTSLKKFGDKVRITDKVPVIGGMGLGEYYLGQLPEEINQWSYGNSPFFVPETGMRLPTIKPGRDQGLADVVSNVGPKIFRRPPPVKRDIFVGEKGAKNLDQNPNIPGSGRLKALERARQMDAKGTKQENIHRATNWHKGPDGQWRYEVNDMGKYGAGDIDAAWLASPSSRELGRILSFPSLYAAYPELRALLVREYIPSSPQDRIRGKMVRARTGGRIAPSGLELSREGMTRGTLLHEIQHLIQALENFNAGSSAAQYKQLPNIYPNLFQKYENKPFTSEVFDIDFKSTEPISRYDLYRATTGEAEAFNVTDRMAYSQRMRKKIPPALAREGNDFIVIPPNSFDGNRYFLHKKTGELLNPAILPPSMSYNSFDQQLLNYIDGLSLSPEDQQRVRTTLRDIALLSGK